MTFDEDDLRLLAWLAELLSRVDPVPAEVVTVAAALTPEKP
jgi:hypothetical protein